MIQELIISELNAVICMALALRLMFFQRGGRQYRHWIGVMAYVLILASAFTPFLIWHNEYRETDPGELIRNLFLLVVVWRAGGNIARVWKID